DAELSRRGGQGASRGGTAARGGSRRADPRLVRGTAQGTRRIATTGRRGQPRGVRARTPVRALPGGGRRDGDVGGQPAPVRAAMVARCVVVGGGVDAARRPAGAARTPARSATAGPAGRMPHRGPADRAGCRRRARRPMSVTTAGGPAGTTMPAPLVDLERLPAHPAE